jgi:hypothetical protein
MLIRLLVEYGEDDGRQERYNAYAHTDEEGVGEMMSLLVYPRREEGVECRPNFWDCHDDSYGLYYIYI